MAAGKKRPKNPCTVYRCVYTVTIGYIHYIRRDHAKTSAWPRAAEGGRSAAASFAGTPAKADRKEDHLDIIISTSSGKPIYEQITDQIKGAILTGELAEGEQLPSIRVLANSLRVSAITTKRAYADLEAAGLIETVQGKGTYVAGGNAELIREERMREVEGLLARAVEQGRAIGLADDEIAEMLALVME